MSYNTKIYDSTNNNYNANFDTYIMGNNNIPVDGNLYYNNKFGKVMTSFIVDSGDSILGGNVLVSENVTILGKCDFKNDLTIGGNVYIPGRIIYFCIETHLSIGLFFFIYTLDRTICRI